MCRARGIAAAGTADPSGEKDLAPDQRSDLGVY